MLAAASHDDGDMFLHAADELKDDRSFVLEAVKVGGMALKYSSEALKEDMEVVEAAVAQQHGSKLKYVSSSLRADKDTELKSNKSIAMDAVLQAGYALEYVS